MALLLHLGDLRDQSLIVFPVVFQLLLHHILAFLIDPSVLLHLLDLGLGLFEVTL